MWFCLVPTPSVATPCATCLGDIWTESQAPRPNASFITVPVASIAGTCFGPGAACARLCSPIFMFASVRWECGRIFGFSDVHSTGKYGEREIQHQSARQSPNHSDSGFHSSFIIRSPRRSQTQAGHSSFPFLLWLIIQ